MSTEPTTEAPAARPLSGRYESKEAFMAEHGECRLSGMEWTTFEGMAAETLECYAHGASVVEVLGRRPW
jgi:hypothetical protein